MRICLVKADKTAGSCWLSLLTDQFVADPFIADQMQQKLTLQRFQLEVSVCWSMVSLCHCQLQLDCLQAFLFGDY